MLKPIFILFLTVLILFLGIHFTSNLIDVSNKELFVWIGIVIVALLIDRILKYLFNYPFKLFSSKMEKASLAKGIQNLTLSASYISFCLAIGVTPINAMVEGKVPEALISNPIFLKVALSFLVVTLVFTLIWVIAHRKS